MRRRVQPGPTQPLRLMSYKEQITAADHDPQKLEQIYRSAVEAGSVEAFREAIIDQYRDHSDNLLLGAWYHRLRPVVEARTPEHGPHQPQWRLALPIGLVTGLACWAISDPELKFLDHLEYLALLWSPIVAISVIGFLVAASGRGWRRVLIPVLSLSVACAYALLIAPTMTATSAHGYLELLVFHLPLLSFIAVGVTLVGWREDHDERFAFLLKSMEVLITAGLFAAGGMVASAITAGMFQSLGVEIPESIVRLAVALGAGMIPVLAITTMYDPGVSPAGQDFHRGLSRLIATLMRLLLPLTGGILVVYLFFIPFNFMGPFENREVLIIYNVMLFAVMALLLGAVPMDAGDLSDRVQVYLRWGIVTVACLAVLVSIHALAAVIYRTAEGGITMNRMTVIGWNTINICIFVLLIFRQARAKNDTWLNALQSVFSTASYGYVAWGLFVVVAAPWLFR